MGHGDDRAGEGGEVTLQPGHGLGIQMVGGFVQQQDVRGLQQQAAQGHAAALAAGDFVHGHVGRRAAQGVHGHFQPGIQIPHALVVHQFLHLGLALDEGVHLLRFHGFGETGIDFLELPGDGHEFAHALFHHLAHGAGLPGQGFLLQIADGVAGSQHGLAVKGFVHTGQDLQQAGLARAVEAQDADLGPVEVREGDVLQHFFLAVALGHADHGINDLVRFVAHSILKSDVCRPGRQGVQSSRACATFQARAAGTGTRPAAGERGRPLCRIPGRRPACSRSRMNGLICRPDSAKMHGSSCPQRRRPHAVGSAQAQCRPDPLHGWHHHRLLGAGPVAALDLFLGGAAYFRHAGHHHAGHGHDPALAGLQPCAAAPP